MLNVSELKEYLESKKYHNKLTAPVHILRKFPELKNVIDFSNENKEFSGQLYCLINDIEYPTCEICGKYISFVSFKKGFLKNCKNKCAKTKFLYEGMYYLKINNQILVCEKHHTFISEKVFKNLVENKAESLCINCSRQIRQTGVLDETKTSDTQKVFKEKFKNRKIFSQDYIENYYPYTYNKILSLKNVFPNNFFNKLFYFTYEFNLKCHNKKCNNLVHFDKKHKPKRYCEYCNRLFATKKTGNKMSELYWPLYIKQNFNNVLDNLSIEIKDIKTLTINNYCKHTESFDISKSAIKHLKSRGLHSICTECNKEYYSSLDIIDVNVLKQNWEIIKTLDETRTLFYNPYIWALINNKMKIHNSSFSEAKFMLNYDISKRPKCIACENEVKFSDDAYAYLTYCEEHKFNFSTSTYEKEISELLEQHNLTIIKNKRDIIHKELDIFLPNLDVAVEVNGTYWHTDNFIHSKNHHYNKWKMCNDKNIKLLTIWEDDWLNKKEILKSIILNECKITKFKVGARECEIRLVDSNEKSKFLDENHLQGTCASTINLGLYHKDELISLMTFGPKRKITNQNNEVDEYELIRFCSKLNYQVMGAASKLFNYFIKNFNPNKIISYASCDISNGKLYETLGFKFIKHTGLNYWWVKNGLKYHRSNFMKHKLIKKGADPNKTEEEIMRDNGYVKIWGTGNLKYEFVV